jgi:tetratricopeptide (TPR) repeat protein
MSADSTTAVAALSTLAVTGALTPAELVSATMAHPLRLLALAALVVVVATGVSAEPPARQGWTGLKAPNFYVIGDVSARDLREVTRRLEQFREAIGILFPKAVLSTSTPTTVVVFKSHKSYEPVKPLYNGKVKGQVAGYFQPGRSMNYVTFTVADGLDQLGIIYHEYVHLIVNNTLDNVPLWFNEGLAEYYRTFDVSSNGQQATLGRVHSEHVLLLREQFLPVADLVRVDHKSPLYNESNRSSVFYAESWALVHYLLLGDNQKYAGHAASFVGALADGVPFDTACQRELGMTGQALDKLLRQYVQHEAFVHQGVRFTERIGKIDDLPVTPVAEAEVHATLGDVLLNMDRPDDARSELDRALALDATFGPAHTSLGVLAERANHWDEARQQLQQAVESPSARSASEYEYAFALAKGSAGGQDDAPKIEKALRRSIELNPSFADAYALLAWQRGQSDGLDEAFQLIGKAITLAPGREQYVLTAANLLARKQDFARARLLLEQIVRNASDEVVRSDARQTLARIADIEQSKAAWDASRAGRGAAAAAEGPTGDPAHGQPGARSSAPASTFVLDLRAVKPGESRMFGTLVSIQCRGGIVLVARTDGGASVRVHAAKFDDIDFVSYRDDLRGQVQCGPRAPADRVLLTFKPDPNSTTSGTAVAVEFVPLDYTP